MRIATKQVDVEAEMVHVHLSQEGQIHEGAYLNITTRFVTIDTVAPRSTIDTAVPRRKLLRKD